MFYQTSLTKRPISLHLYACNDFHSSKDEIQPPVCFVPVATRDRTIFARCSLFVRLADTQLFSLVARYGPTGQVDLDLDYPKTFFPFYRNYSQYDAGRSVIILGSLSNCGVARLSLNKK